MKHLAWTLAWLLAALLLPSPSHAAASHDACTGFVTSPYQVIDQPGTWCLAQDVLNTCEGRCPPWGVQIESDDVVLDCQDHALDLWLQGGGRGVVVRRCDLRGGRTEIGGDWALIEDNRIRGSLYVGGNGVVVRRNWIRAGGFGIVVGTGDVSLEDNLIDSLSGSVYYNGILVQAGVTRLSVVRNYVRGFPTIAIYSQAPATARMIVADNVLTGTGAVGSAGIWCQNTQIRVRRNLIAGYGNPMVQCGDAGGNHVSP